MAADAPAAPTPSADAVSRAAQDAGGVSGASDAPSGVAGCLVRVARQAETRRGALSMLRASPRPSFPSSDSVQSFSISVASFTMQGCIATKVGRPRTAIHLVDRRAHVDLQLRNHLELSTIRAAAFKICAPTVAAPTAVTPSSHPPSSTHPSPPSRRPTPPRRPPSTPLPFPPTPPSLFASRRALQAPRHVWLRPRMQLLLRLRLLLTGLYQF